MIATRGGLAARAGPGARRNRPVRAAGRSAPEGAATLAQALDVYQRIGSPRAEAVARTLVDLGDLGNHG